MRCFRDNAKGVTGFRRAGGLPVIRCKAPMANVMQLETGPLDLVPDERRASQ